MTADARQVERLREFVGPEGWRWSDEFVGRVVRQHLPDLLATAEAHAALVKAVEGAISNADFGDYDGHMGFVSTDELTAILAATDTANRGAR